MDSPIPKVAVIYARVSTKDQVQNTSLKAQERACREFAAKEGIKVAKVFIDEGESAKTIDRPQFLAAITYCQNKKNQVNRFLVYKLDRFSRNQEDHIMTYAVLRKAGVVLISATEPIDESVMGKALRGMISVFAELDNNLRAERTKNGMLERVKQGVWVWPCPLGYYKPKNAANIAPDPKVAPYIKLAFEEYAKGTYTFKALAEHLAERGLRTRHGKRPRFQVIEKLLKNPLYYGMIEAWGKSVQGDFEPIIDETLFNKCQGLSSSPSVHALPRHANNPAFPLRKLVACTSCGQPLTGSFTTGRQGKRYPYYHHNRQGCPNAKSLPKEKFEAQFTKLLGTITPDRRYEALLKAIVTDYWKEGYKKLDTLNAVIRREIEKLEQERQRVFDLHRSGAYTDEEFKEQKSIVNQKIQAQRTRMQKNDLDEFNMEQALDYCFHYVRQTSREWLEAIYPERLRLQKLIFEGSVMFDGKSFGNTKVSPVYRLNQEYGGEKSHLVAPRGIEPRLPA